MINQHVSIDELNKFCSNTMLETLGIEITELGPIWLCGKMPVDKRTHQPAGLLHGGASATLIESLGSLGSSLIADMKTQNVFGIEINANHIKGVKEGFVFGKAELIHGGKTTHIWQGTITDENGKLVCTGRLTVLITQKKQ
ncbi:MAG: hotdog fold thioesterase [Crocinitomicaceae bacterium]|nr:hotdog fold thioesterase [Crocinitomicaceae bacterium]